MQAEERGSAPRQSAAGQSLRWATRSGAVIDATEVLTGCVIERAYVDKGYRGHDAQNPRCFFISGQKRGVFGVIKHELKRRSAIEPVIGHMKADGHLGRCYLKGRHGDAANVVLSAVGYNFRRIPRLAKNSAARHSQRSVKSSRNNFIRQSRLLTDAYWELSVCEVTMMRQFRQLRRRARARGN